MQLFVLSFDKLVIAVRMNCEAKNSFTKKLLGNPGGYFILHLV